MNPLVILSVVIGAAVAAPGNYGQAGSLIAAGGPAAVGLGPAAVGLGSAAVGLGPAAAVGVAAAPAPAISLPAPFTTAEVRGAPRTTIHKPAPIVSKQLHYGSTTYVSGYKTDILKPPTPHLPIAVPTALKGTVATNPAVVRTVKEQHVAHQPYQVEKRVDVPYDVPVVREQVQEVAVPVHVPRPYAVPRPVPVAGEPIVNVRTTAPVVQRTHSNVVEAPVAGAALVPAGVAVAPAGAALAPAGAVLAPAGAALAPTGVAVARAGVAAGYGYAAGLPAAGYGYAAGLPATGLVGATGYGYTAGLPAAGHFAAGHIAAGHLATAAAGPIVATADHAAKAY